MVAVSQVFRAHDFLFQIAATDSELIDVADDLFCDMVTNPIGRGPVHQFEVVPSVQADHLRVVLDGIEQYRTLSVGSLISHLLIEVNTNAVRATKHLIALHAGAALSPDGRAVIFPGQSHSGKTTLVTQLSLGGWRFVADEVSVLSRSDLAVVPYGKPVALRPSSVAILHDRIPRLRAPGSRFETDERFVPPRELGPVSTSCLPVAVIVFPAVGQASDFACNAVTPGETLTRLTHSLLDTSSITVNTFRDLERLTNRAASFHLSYGTGPIQPALVQLLSTNAA